jgi:hypothetical protein
MSRRHNRKRQDRRRARDLPPSDPGAPEMTETHACWEQVLRTATAPGGYKTVTDLVLASIVMWSSGDDDPTVR